MKIAVIGAGINGLSVSVNLLESFPGISVTIYTENVSPNTTGDVAAGLWNPYALSADEYRLEKWLRTTFAFFKNFIATDPNHHKYGVCYIEMHDVSEKNSLKTTLVHSIVDNYHFMNERELSRYPGMKSGISWTTIISDGHKLLKYFSDKFIKLGGKIKIQKIENFDEVQMKENYSIVINCTGLGARKLCNDFEIYPVRGQVIRVEAPWIKYTVTNENHYIIPQSDGIVVLGGTKQENNWNIYPDENDTKFILEGCSKLLVGLKNPKIVSIKVGLRPRRSSVRLESETRINLLTNEKYTLIHNYGHGGSGFTLFWGCSENVKELVEQYLKGRKPVSRL